MATGGGTGAGDEVQMMKWIARWALRKLPMREIDKILMEREDLRFNERLKQLHEAGVDFGGVNYYVSDFGTLKECMHPSHRFGD
jgi:hypothetical protein